MSNLEGNPEDRFSRDAALIVFLPYITGGTISIVTREEHLHTVEEYIDKLEPLMQKLENEGKWKQLKREIFKGFFLDKDGILWKYQVC